MTRYFFIAKNSRWKSVLYIVVKFQFEMSTQKACLQRPFRYKTQENQFEQGEEGAGEEDHVHLLDSGEHVSEIQIVFPIRKWSFAIS